MKLGFAGGMAAFMNGVNQGEDRSRLQAREDKQASWLDETQQQQRNTWNRATKQQAKDDVLNASLGNVGAPVDEVKEQAGPLPTNDDGTTTPLEPIKSQRAPTRDEQYERAGKAYSVHGDPGSAFKMEDAARDERARSSAAAFSQLQNNSTGLATRDLLDRAVSIFNNDPGVGHIENLGHGNDGSVSFDVVNKQTGQRMSKTFKDSGELLGDLRTYFSPAEQARVVEQKRAAAQKRIDERSKIYSLPAGSSLQNAADGVLGTNSNEPAAVQAARIRADAITAKNGAKQEKVHPILDATFGEGEKQLIPLAQGFGDQLLKANPGMTESDAFRIAAQYARGGGKNIAETFNMDTGKIDRVYHDGDQRDAKGVITESGSGRDFPVSSEEYGVGARVTDVMAKDAVAKMQTALPPNVFATYAKTATPEGMNEFVTQANSASTQLINSAKQRMLDAKTPQERAEVEKSYQLGLERLQNETRKARLVSKFYTIPAPPGATATPASGGGIGGLFAKARGMFGNSTPSGTTATPEKRPDYFMR